MLEELKKGKICLLYIYNVRRQTRKEQGEEGEGEGMPQGQGGNKGKDTEEMETAQGGIKRRKGMTRERGGMNSQDKHGNDGEVIE